ncbi:clusterin [Myripristis murdjan]|uniref:Clusterin n=1 Tax=Myripristis murdjan TaxID=586833 RepID=A0A667YUP3_9TELE|nr:clusterin [Myripristis murdjan]
MLMMIMMMKKKAPKSLAVVALFLASANCIVPPSKEDLSQISIQGEKYLDKQIENAISGVKEMKNVMEQSTEDHKNFLSDLEITKKQKEDALLAAQEIEAKLEQEEEVCNETMKALWEECKPCLKNTCIKYYSQTCHSGSGLVGRQLDEVLNRTSPFSIWINGESIGNLERKSEEQREQLKNLEERYSEVVDNVNSIFRDSMKVFDHMPTFHLPMFPMPFRMPSLWGSGPRVHRGIEDQPSRVARSPFFNRNSHTFQSIFSPPGMSSVFVMDMNDMDVPTSEDGSVNEDVITTTSNGMTCRQIRRNSAGCIRFRGECQKCKEIQHIDCSGKKPLEGPLKEELEEALAMADHFTKEYNEQMRRFEEKMFNTSSILDWFNKQFGWVSTLANNTRTEDGLFSIQTLICKDDKETAGEEQTPGETNVSVKLFDTPPMNFTVPGDIPWTDPKFSEVVAQEALDRYKETAVVVK